MRINAIILAAGASRRFGENKLIKPYKGKTVIEHLLKKLEGLPFEAVYVVTSKITYDMLEDVSPFNILLNHQAKQGISSSIKLGLSESCACDAYCFIVADQVALKKETIAQMLQTYQDQQIGILCASYKQELGNPVIFHKKYKDELMELKGDKGGKKVLEKHLEDVMLFKVKEEHELMDIDTQEDWDRLCKI